MKKLLFLLFAIMAFAACSKDDEAVNSGNNEPIPEKPKSEIKLNTTSLDFERCGGYFGGSLFSTTAPWTAEVINSRADGWLTISPTSGDAGNAIMSIRYAENDTPNDRSASIVIKAGASTETITVNQKQKDALTVTASKFEIDDEGGEILIEVMANIDFDYVIEESAKEWVKYNTTRAYEASTLVFNVEKNEGNKREAKITIESGEFSEEVRIYQESGVPTIILSKNNSAVTSDATTIVVDVKSNVDVAVEIPSDVDWISENTTRAFSTNTYYFDISQNDTGETRYAKIHFTNKANDVTESITVIQLKQDEDIVSELPPNNEIWYTSYDGEIVTPFKTDVFGANIVSNTYIDGKGVITFDGNVSQVGNSAFENAKAYDYPTDNLETVILPNSVTSIGAGAFAVTNITEIVLPDNIETLGVNALIGCQDLESIRLPKNLKTIGSNALRGCRFKEIIIPENVTSIDNYAFHENEELEKVLNLSNKITHFGIGVFRNVEVFEGELASEDNRCLIIDGELLAFAPRGLTEYVIPDNVTSIGRRVFSFLYNKQLEHITIPEGVIKIGDSAFEECSALLEITIPKSVKEIGGHAFSECSSLKTVNIYNDDISVGLFSYCTSLKEIVIPDNITTIGSGAFSGCANLSNIIWGKNISIIKEGAFAGTNLRSVTIPESVTVIEDQAFKSDNLMEFNGKFASEDKLCLIVDGKLIQMADGVCKSLTSYKIPVGVKEIGHSVFAGYENLQELEISHGVKIIGTSGLEGCKNLKSIVLPSTITNLGNCVFRGCDKVSEIYFKSERPPGIWGTIAVLVGWIPCDPGTLIRVPDKSIADYKAAPEWGGAGYKILGWNEELYLSSDFSQDGVVTALQTASAGNGIDVIIMGDAYSDRQIADGKYTKDISRAIEHLFAEEPYKSFRDLFNIYQVTAVSKGEGYGAGATALEGYFGNGTEVGGNQTKVLEYARKAISDDRMDEALIIVIMNREYYAGTCYMYSPSLTSDWGGGTSISYFPLGTDEDVFAGLIRHEAGGHGFSKLGDEYAYEHMGVIPQTEVDNANLWTKMFGWWKNVDFISDPTKVKWSHFLTDERYAYDGLGVYDGAFTYWTGAYRPTYNSIMNQNVGGFNAPSRESIYYRIHKLAYGADWEYDYEKFVEWDAKNRKIEAETRGVPYRLDIQKDFKPTHEPVIMNKSWRDEK